jgi:hypothetical protein
MKTRLLFGVTILALGLGAFACGKSEAPSTTNSNAAKPSTAAASPAKKEPAKPKTELASSKKPEEGNAKTVAAAKKVPVPDNWIYIYDDVKRYAFSVPEGTKGDTDSAAGVNVFVAQTSAPSDVSIFVLAYKDKTLTKEDLLKDAVKFLEELGEKVTVGALSDEGPDYGLADASTVTADGQKGKWRILVGTDVTDNYVMIVGTDEAKFDANKDVIDAIWGSFEMW